MSVAIVTDSTCDLHISELEQLGVRRVPLYVMFKGETFKDWETINPNELIEGINEGADMPSTSQPSPQDFIDVFNDAIKAGQPRLFV